FILGNIQCTDFSGYNLSTYRPREFSYDVGYSRRLSPKLGIGVALRYINSSLAKGDPNNSGVVYKPGNAVSGDLSLFHTGVNDVGQGWNWGITLSNLGSKIGYTSDAQQKDYIPANLGLGAAYTWVFDETSKLTAGVDMNKLLVPTPPSLSDSAALVNYRNKSVINSWFSSLGDAGGFGEEIKEVQVSL